MIQKSLMNLLWSEYFSHYPVNCLTGIGILNGSILAIEEINRNGGIQTKGGRSLKSSSQTPKEMKQSAPTLQNP